MDSRLLFLPTVVVALAGFVFWWQLRPADFAIVMAALVLANLMAAWWLTRQRRDWWSFSLLPILLVLSGFAYSLVIMNETISLLAVIVVAVLALLYWRLVFLYIHDHAAYRPFSLEHLFDYVSFAIIFFSVAAAYGLKTFLDLPLWQPAAVIVAVTIGVAYLWQWVRKIEWHQAWPYIAFFPIIIGELFFIFAFLPLDFTILGFLLASIWYAASYFSVSSLAGRLTVQQFRLVGGMLLILWLILLLTARWF